MNSKEIILVNPEQDSCVKSKEEYMFPYSLIYLCNFLAIKGVKSKIFDLYFTTKKDGSGIGLSICKNIMEAHEGKLYFKSKVGKGTTFIMEFPAKEKTTLYTSRFANQK